MTTIRIATYNIHFGGRGREQLITHVLHAVNADVIVLTEAQDEAVIKFLGQELGMEVISGHSPKTSLAILSKLPLIAWKSHHPQNIGRPLLEATVSISQQQSLTLYGLHLQCHFFRWNEQQRVRELTAFLPFIQPHQPHVILGDFNAIAEGDRLDETKLPIKVKVMRMWERGRLYHDTLGLLQKRGYQDCYRVINPHLPGFTLPAESPNARLDYIFANQLMAEHLVNCDVLSSPVTHSASDHIPVWAEFDV